MLDQLAFAQKAVAGLQSFGNYPASHVIHDVISQFLAAYLIQFHSLPSSRCYLSK